jgi:anti-anti-sigma factor
MAVNVRFDDDVVVLSNLGRLMNDPRHFDAGRDVQALAEQGYRKFVVALRGVGALGPSGVGLLMTITRVVRKFDGDVVLAGLSPPMEKLMDELRMDAFWEVFDSVEDAVRAFKE